LTDEQQIRVAVGNIERLDDDLWRRRRGEIRGGQQKDDRFGKIRRSGKERKSKRKRSLTIRTFELQTRFVGNKMY
jgi:hypothetical protein